MSESRYIGFFPINLFPSEEKYKLYFEGDAPSYREGHPVLLGGQELIVDGAMSSLYEREVYGSTGIRSFRLRLRVKGSVQATLFHTDHTGKRQTKATGVSDDARGVFQYAKNYLILDKDMDQHQEEHEIFIEFSIHSADAAYGRWGFTVTPAFGWAEIVGAEWEIGANARREVVPAFVICTFNRIAQLQNNLTVLSRELDDAAQGYRIFIVDNANSFNLLPSHNAERITIIPQKNVGGAGGFGRGIHEGLNDNTITHLILLDDDADIDAVSIKRMINTFKFMKNDFDFVGGVQMDVYDPLKLADASAYWRVDQFEMVHARLLPCYLDDPDAKNALSRGYYTNFNGWWLFGGGRAAFEENGMPLPIFVHLDDVDFGARADVKGNRTWTMPGIAVWHEPYYAKVEGWFSFYNIRNELIRLCGQLPLLISEVNKERASDKIDSQKMLSKRISGVGKKLKSRYRNFVSTNQYGSAYLLCMAVDRFLDGPNQFLGQNFGETHIEVMNNYKIFNENYRKLERPPIGRAVVPTGSRNNRFYKYLQFISYNGHYIPRISRKSFKSLPLFRERMDISWTELPMQSDFAYSDPQDGSMHYYEFRKDFGQEIRPYFNRVMKKFDRHCKKIGPEWADAYAYMTSKEYWNRIIPDFDIG